MARVNHNVNYIYDVDGETVWEKLRVIRGFLQDRELAYEVAKLNLKEATKLNIDSKEYMQSVIFKPQTDQNIQDCVNEIKFLKEFESYLSAEAEKTRIDGKTDDEMYEINYFHEMEVRLVRKAQAQVVSNGRITEELMLRLMKNKNALRICVEQGLLTNDIFTFVDTPLLPSPDTHTIQFIAESKND
jgi:hypothetical protein